MTESTLIVNPGTAGLYDEKHIEDPGVTMMAYVHQSTSGFAQSIDHPRCELAVLAVFQDLQIP